MNAPALPRPVPWVLAATWLLIGARFVLARHPGTDVALRGLPLDDSFIHLVYAQALAAFQGFAYNPGQLETGSTSPLWAILLVPAIWKGHLGVDPVLAIKATGLAVGFGCSLLAARIANRVAGRPWACVAGMAIALDPWVGFTAVSGMEPLLVSLLLLLAVDLLLGGRPRLAACALGLAPLARPEAASLAAIAGLWLLASSWKQAKDRQSTIRNFGRTALLATYLTAPSIAWMTYCLAVTGRPLPNTFYVKSSTGQALTGANLQAFAEVFGGILGAGFVVLALAVAGAIVIVRGARGFARSGAILLAAAPVVYLLSVASVSPIRDPHAYYYLRYLVPAFPLLLLLAALGAAAVVRAARARTKRRSWVPVAIGAMAVWFLALPRAHAAAVERYAWNAQNIEEVQVAIARHIAVHAAPGDLVATTDAGAIRYYGRRPVLDLVGLNNHRVLERGIVARVTATPPRWIAFQPPLLPGLLRAPGYEEAGRWKSEHYTIVEAPETFAEMVLLRATEGTAN